MIFALTPLFFLFAHNMTELSFFERQTLIRLGLSSLIILLCSWGMFGMSCRILGNSCKAGIFTTLLLCFVFGYGYFYKVLVEYFGIYEIFSIKPLMTFGYNKLYLVCCTLLLAFAFYRLKKTSRNFWKITYLFNLFALVLLVLSWGQIFTYEVQRIARHRTMTTSLLSPRPSTENETHLLPDIYYIILDAYAADNVLLNEFGYDNHEFTAYLRQKGFYVATESRSNYPFTVLSLASSLNFDYLDALTNVVGTATNDQTIAVELIENNNVIRFLKDNGYKFIHFNTIYAPTSHNRNADRQIDCERGMIKDQFLKMFLRMTILDPFILYFSKGKREEISCQFSTLAELSSEAVSRFIFAHIIAPHEPYVFGANGEAVERHLQEIHQANRIFDEEGKILYINQLQYINTKMQELIETLLNNSQQQPIIILQADHGARIPTVRNPEPLWFSILNAYYLPDGNISALYPSISPVNTFRMIFNTYFHTSYTLLPDRSYYSDIYHTPYQFIEVSSD